MMSLKSKISEINNITVIKLGGEYDSRSREEIKDIILSGLKRANNKKLVVDFSELTGQRSIVETIQRAESMPKEFKTVKIAHIESVLNMRLANDEETIHRNRGFKFKSFLNINDGINWLKGQS
ncbi:MAG: anti-sigma factor antagonist [Melioribacteraceae bacterium]|nr:anti-sigma factor antagonist [Melioribacteraceae bacterium]